jgi:hypothetical protein
MDVAQQNITTDNSRKPLFDRAVVFGIFAPCFLFWAVVVVVAVKFL